MGKSQPQAPAAPDYTGAAQAQGQANLIAAQQGAVISNPNIISPYGNQTVTWGQADPNNPGGGQQATVTQTLTPAAQAALDSQQQVQKSEADLANQGIQKAGTYLNNGFQFQGPGIQTGVKDAGAITGGPSADQYGLAGGINANAYGQAQNSVDMSGVAKMPVNAGTTGQQAIMQRLQPQIDQTQAATAQRLANQGIPQGSEAWNNAMRQQGQDFNDLYSQAALQGINLDMSANQQGYGQALSNAGLFNSALGQNFGQGAQAQQINNSAVSQNFGQGQAAASMQNAAQNQQYNQNLQSMGAANAAQGQSMSQQQGLYNMPLNQITALMSGSQIQNPQFQAYSGQNVAAAPVFQGAQAQGNYEQGLYGQQMAGYNAGMQALGSIGAAGASFIPNFGKSDRRLKSNVVHIGEHPIGVPAYEYDIEGRHERGVMAQDLLSVRPDAVAVHPSGFLMVNYDAIGGRP